MLWKALRRAEILYRGHAPFPLRWTMVGRVEAWVSPFCEEYLWMQANNVLNYVGKGKSILNTAGAGRHASY